MSIGSMGRDINSFYTKNKNKQSSLKTARVVV